MGRCEHLVADRSGYMNCTHPPPSSSAGLYPWESFGERSFIDGDVEELTTIYLGLEERNQKLPQQQQVGTYDL